MPRSPISQPRDASGVRVASATRRFVSVSSSNVGAQYAAASNQRLGRTGGGTLSAVGTPFMVGAWVRDMVGTNASYFSRYNVAANKRGWRLYRGASLRLNFGISTNGTAETTLSSAVNGNTIRQSHLCVGAYDPVGNLMYSWIDDVATTPIAGPGPVFNNDADVPFDLGGDDNNALSMSGVQWSGFFCQQFLSAAELTYLYNAGGARRWADLPAALQAKFAGWWELGEASGTRLDSTAHGNDLTPANTPTSNTGNVPIPRVAA